MKDIIPKIRGLNLGQLKIDFKNALLHRVSTIQLLHRIDIYQLSTSDRTKLQELTSAKEQQDFIKMANLSVLLETRKATVSCFNSCNSWKSLSHMCMM